MDLTKLSTQELKALAYDQLVEMQRAQNNINLINAEIAKQEKEGSSSLEAKKTEDKQS